MHAVERLGTVQWSGELQRRIHAVHGSVPRGTPQLHVCRFEDCPIRNLDFIYSVDVMEHVQDLRLIFRAAFNALKPGGMFVNAIDFRGHNAFNLESAPLNFLICNDWLYELMHSHIVTSNRVRIGQAVEALTAEGFEVKAVICTRQASLDYVRRVRPRLLPRFRSIPESELMVLEALVSARKPLEPACAVANAEPQSAPAES
jgi:SAM-dependent methyltransferase